MIAYLLCSGVVFEGNMWKKDKFRVKTLKGKERKNFVPRRILRSCDWDQYFEDINTVFHLKTFEDHQEEIRYILN